MDHTAQQAQDSSVAASRRTAEAGSSNADAEHVGDVASLGVPAALQQKGEQLLQQLQEGQEAATEAVSQEADGSGSHQLLLGTDTCEREESHAAVVESISSEAAADSVSTSKLSDAEGDGLHVDDRGVSNPFEGADKSEEEGSSGVRLVLEPEWGILAPGTSATVQVRLCSYPYARTAGVLCKVQVGLQDLVAASCCSVCCAAM